ncbi:MAG TPA: serine hydrolase, partial [Chitinophagaceae bacterium]|nr:serine hydrolase [Chitinophagaceae bacterium]
GTMMMKGMQDAGVMACAKHFPGHGDVSVDSHLDLPVITKTRFQLDSLELYPFKELFKAGVGSVMIAHLYIPAIDSAANRATSLSYSNVTGLLRNELHYQGLTFTDALEMQGVKKFFPDGQAAVESLIAGNDMLCLPGDVQLSINKIKEAIKDRRLTWEDINTKVKKVLAAKYKYVLPNVAAINTAGLAQDLNAAIPGLRKMTAENAITLVKNEDRAIFPLLPAQQKKIAYLGIGLFEDNAFARRMREDYKADIYYFDYRMTSDGNDSIINKLKGYDVVVSGVHNYTKYPANNFGLSWASTQLMKRVQQETTAITLFFGNPYAIKNNCDAKNIIACYEDDSLFQHAAADILEGKLPARGKLPVTICAGLPFGTGIIGPAYLPVVAPVDSVKADTLLKIDSIVNDAIVKKATPGCVVLAAKGGKVLYNKAFGNYSWDDTGVFVREGYGDSRPCVVQQVTIESIYDLASLTKIFATTLAIMKLYDEGKIDLKKTLSNYLPWVKGTNKAGLVIEDVLLHQAGLVSWIPFYKETLVPGGSVANYTIYTKKPTSHYSVRVADSMYMRNDWVDTIYKRILESPLGSKGKYVYSDLDFIFLGKIVEAITGVGLDEYVTREFYNKLHLFTAGYKPREHFALDQIVPTEREIGFRSQLIRGDVHDPAAAMLGGVAGHAGLFSDAYDLAVLSQLLLNGGSIGGQQFIKKSTVDLFTAYHSETSRRGYGFDKPERDNADRKEPYPCASASPLTYGHAGFTGTCVWIDPVYDLVYIFLSNRVNSFGSNKLAQMDVRGKVQEVIYRAINTKQ